MRCNGCESEYSASINAGVFRRTWDAIVAYVACTVTVTEMELRRLWHDPSELFARVVQPLLWLIIFGEAFSRVRVLPTGSVSYRAFLTPGVLSQSMLFIAIFYGLSIIWDRDQGVLQKMLAMPVPRASFVTGKAVSAGVRALSQVLIIMPLALVLGIKLSLSPLGVLLSMATLAVGAMFFSSLSMIFASIVKTRERFMGVSQVIIMPLFFASNALYPINVMPSWLQVLAKANPLSYVVELLRVYLIGGPATNVAKDWGLLLVATGIVQVIATRLYPRVIS